MKYVTNWLMMISWNKEWFVHFLYFSILKFPHHLEYIFKEIFTLLSPSGYFICPVGLTQKLNLFITFHCLAWMIQETLIILE